MKAGDQVKGGWVAAVASARDTQAVYVSPPGEWRWARDVEPTGVSIPAVAVEISPRYKKQLVIFLLRNGYGTVEAGQVAGVSRKFVTKVKKELGLRLKPWRKEASDEQGDAE